MDDELNAKTGNEIKELTDDNVPKTVNVPKTATTQDTSNSTDNDYIQYRLLLSEIKRLTDKQKTLERHVDRIATAQLILFGLLVIDFIITALLIYFII